MRRLKRWGLAGLLILLVMEILTIAPKKIGGPQDSAAAKTEDIPARSAIATMSQIMKGVHVVGTSEGRRLWELDADTGEMLKEKGTWELQGVRVKFFGNTGSVYTVTGKEGRVQIQTKDMEIRGNVVATNSEGYVFKTKTIRYAAKLKSLSTPDEVEVTGPKSQGPLQLSGKGFKAETDASVMTLDENVHAVKELSAEKTMNIKSAKARINGKSGEAHFENDVQVDLDAVRMTGNVADFSYEKDKHTLKSMLMKGNVKVTDQRHWASSQYAQVLFDENEFVLYGNPRVIQDDNELKGEEIRFLQGGKQVSVTKARARVENRAEFKQRF